jgi:hypothetical protein
VFAGKNVDFHERLVVAHEIPRFLGWKNDVQALRKSPEETHEFKAEILVVKQIKERIMIRQVRQPMLFEEFHDRQLTGTEFAQFLLRETEHVQHLVLFAFVVVVESLFQMVNRLNATGIYALFMLPPSANTPSTAATLDNAAFVTIKYCSPMPAAAVMTRSASVSRIHRRMAFRDALPSGVKEMARAGGPLKT